MNLRNTALAIGAGLLLTSCDDGKTRALQAKTAQDLAKIEQIQADPDYVAKVRAAGAEERKILEEARKIRKEEEMEMEKNILPVTQAIQARLDEISTAYPQPGNLVIISDQIKEGYSHRRGEIYRDSSNKVTGYRLEAEPGNDRNYVYLFRELNTDIEVLGFEDTTLGNAKLSLFSHGSSAKWISWQNLKPELTETCHKFALGFFSGASIGGSSIQPDTPADIKTK